MLAVTTVDDALVRRLPLPLAQLYLRAHNAKSVGERHGAAYFLWEAGLKLLAATAVAAYARRPGPDPELARRLENLARPSLGHWWEFVRLLLPPLSEADAGFRAARDLLFGKPRPDLPRAAGLDAALREALEGRAGSRSTVRPAELFERLVTYRNREIGHGAPGQKPARFYEATGRALLAGGAELFARLDLLAGRRLIYVSEVHQAGGAWLAHRYELTGESARRVPSLEVPLTAPDRLPRAERLYLEGPAGDGPDALTPLHPLIAYDPDAGQCLFLNARRGERRLEYLDYTTGAHIDLPDHGGELRALLGRLLGAPVTPNLTESWAARSVAEEQPGQPAEPAGFRTLGEFELLGELGRGGMGVVYRAWQPSLGRQVALKCLLNAGDARAEARFLREVRALGRVEHPNLVRVFTSGSDGDRWFYAMELVDGAPLSAVCERLQPRATRAVDLATWQGAVNTACFEVGGRTAEGGGTISSPPPSAVHPPPAESGRSYVRQIAELGRQVAGAAHALHEAGIIHRDIKPGNVLVTNDGAQAVLTDLGLAQLADEEEGRLTRTRQFVGTLRYASPQQILAAGVLDRRSDVYSLGATLWESLALRPLYGATDQTPIPTLMEQIQREEPERLGRANPAVGRDLEAVVHRCLEKSPERRYATAKELADDLVRYLAGEPVRARPVRGLERAAKWARRRPALSGLLAALALAVAGGFAGVTLMWRTAAANYARADEERSRAEKRLELAVGGTRAVGELARRLRPVAGTETRTIRAILETAAENYEKLLTEAGSDPPPLLLEGRAAMLTDFSEVYLALNDSGRAADSGRQAVALWERLNAGDQGNDGWQAGFARARLRLASALVVQGDSTAALAEERAAVEICRRLVARGPDDPGRQDDLAGALGELIDTLEDRAEDTAGIESARREVLVIREKLAGRPGALPGWQVRFAETLRRAGYAAYMREQYPAALGLYRRAEGMLQRVLAADLQDTEALGGLADINYSVGLVHKWSGDGPAAQAALELAVELAGPLVQRDPPNVRWQTTLFQSRRERNDVLLDPASLTPAALVAATARRLHDLEAERAFLEARSAGDPLNAKAKGMLQTIYIETGQVVAVRGLLGGDVRPALSEARAWFDRARQLADELARLDPALPHWARAPVQSSHLSSLLHWAQGDPRAALGELLSAWEARRGWLERRAAEALGDPARALELAEAEAEVGRLTVRLAEAGSSPSKALTRALSGFALRYGIPVELPGGPGGSTPPAAELEKALVWYERSRGRYRALAASRPDDPRRLGGLADSWQHTAYVFALLGRREAMDAASAEHAQVAGLLAARQPAPAPPASSAAGPPECSVWVTVRHVLYAQERVVLGRRAVSENALRFLVTPGPAEAGLMAQACLRQARLLQSLPMPEAKAEAKQVLGSAVAFLRAARPGGPPAELQPAITQIEAALRDTPGPG